MLAVHQRPQGSGIFRILIRTAEEPRANPEEDTATQHKSFRLLISPWKGLEQRQPRVLQLG